MDYIRRLKYSRMSREDLRAARANRVFCTDEQHIRTENTVMVNTKHSVWVLYKIAAYALRNDHARLRKASVRLASTEPSAPRVTPNKLSACAEV